MLCILWLVGVALVVLAPVLAHGTSFGAFDTLSQFGVLRHQGIVVHNIQAGDQADATIPWITLAWTQVHHGQLPLWNPFGALGMPLTFNWQTATFSVPALVGYLFPVNLVPTVHVLLTLIIAGSGVYVLGRVLRLGTLGCIFAATVFELSGPMLGWLGWIHASAMSWAGWLFAAAILIVRGQHRVRCVVFFALMMAALIFAGSPEIVLLLGLALAVFLVVLLALRIPLLKGSGPILRPILDLSVAVVTGCSLGAPLLLPGRELISVSQRGVTGGDPAELIPGNPPLPPHNLLHLIFQGYDGLPIAGSQWFGYILGYSETAAYVGVIALVLAAMAVALRRQQPEVIAFGVLAVAMAAVAFFPPLVAGLGRLPLIGAVLWQRALLPLAFVLAVLAGVGIDAFVRARDPRAVLRWAGGGFAVAAAVLVAIWLFGRGHLPPAEAAIRNTSFIWPAVETAAGLAVVGGLILVHRRSRTSTSESTPSRVGLHRWAGLLLLVCETAFLVAAGAPLWTSTSSPFAPTPAEMALKRAVGPSLVGFGAPLCFFPPGLGILPNAQVAYGVRELALYDPMIPNAYFKSWRDLTHRSAGNANDSAYCPVVNTADEARLYGVGFVLEPTGIPGPTGAEFSTRIGDEDLYRIPNAAPATLTPIPTTGEQPANGASGVPVAVTHPSPASWRVIADAAGPGVLRLRLTDVPGWHASIDGQPAPLRRFAGVMLQVDVPTGRHTVNLYYWPATFTFGIVLAACATAGLIVALIIERLRHRRRPTAGPSSANGAATPASGFDEL